MKISKSKLKETIRRIVIEESKRLKEEAFKPAEVAIEESNKTIAPEDDEANLMNPDRYEYLSKHNPEVIKILDDYDENNIGYTESSRIAKNLNAIGWAADYDLSGEIYAVWKLTEEA
jgi:hypothetical protein